MITADKSLAQGDRQSAAAGNTEAVYASPSPVAYLTTREASECLKVTPRQVRYLIQRLRLPATPMGRDWIIEQGEVQKLLDLRESKRQRAESGDSESMKRSPLRARTERPKTRRSKPRRVSVLRDPKYRRWLKNQPCIACNRDPTSAKTNWAATMIIDPCHTELNGRGSKGSDASCIPLCRWHHDEMDGRLGTDITTKEAFAVRYGLDLGTQAAVHYFRYQEGGTE
jgi:excisionase family DNA binding protein